MSRHFSTDPVLGRSFRTRLTRALLPPTIGVCSSGSWGTPYEQFNVSSWRKGTRMKRMGAFLWLAVIACGASTPATDGSEGQFTASNLEALLAPTAPLPAPTAPLPAPPPPAPTIPKPPKPPHPLVLHHPTALHCLWVGQDIIRVAPGAQFFNLYYANPSGAQAGLNLTGTDLGFSFTHQGKTFVLFGDTWGKSIPTSGDDDAIAIYDQQQPGSCPTLTFAQTANGPFDPMRVWYPVYSGCSTTWSKYTMSAFRTPVAGFSLDAGGVFGMFLVDTPSCDPDASSCDPGDRCACAGPACACVALTPDPQNPQQQVPYHLRAAPLVVGQLDPVFSPGLNMPGRDFYQRARLNLKNFVNVSARVVPHFEPYNPSGNVYYLDPNNPSLNEPAVLVWGKPAFGSAFKAMPTYLMYYAPATTGWTPYYFTGTSAGGIPQWDSDPAHAASMAPVVTSEEEVMEGQPILTPGQISVTYSAELSRWVMIYGGRPAGMVAADNPVLGIYLRTARQPWGPWSSPVRVWSAVSDGAYAPGSFMFHPSTNRYAYDDQSGYGATNPGFEYGAAIVEQLSWAADGHQHLYWAMSTHNPYRVVLMHTELYYTPLF